MILQYVHREATDALPQIDTLRYQQKEMGNKGRTKVITSFVNTAVCQKASVRLKRHPSFYGKYGYDYSQHKKP